MIYSLEDLYKHFGQYDKSIAISFIEGSSAHSKYGGSIIGTFHFSPTERARLQQTIDNQNTSRNDGNIKVTLSNISELSRDLKDSLFYDGVKASDILNVIQYNSPLENKYVENEIRSLPEATEIKVDFRGIDEDSLFITLIQIRKKKRF